MMKRLLTITTLLLALAGCGAGASPWSSQSPAAEKAPRPLIYAAEQPPAGQVASQPPGMPNAPYVPPADNAFDVVVDGSAATQPAPPAQMQSLPPVKVALLAPLSGSHKNIGEAMLQAAQLALFDMGYESFELMPRDTQSTAAGARQAAESAVNSGAQLILGPLLSSSVQAVRPVARQHNINMIAFSTDWTQAGGNTYIMGFLPFSQIRRIVEYAAESGLRRIGILAPNTEYGNAVITAYNGMAYQAGLSTAQVSRFQPSEKDFTGIVQRFTGRDINQPAGPAPFDAVLLPVGGEEARAIANSLSYYDMDAQTVRRLGTGLWDDPGLAAEPALDGALFAAPAPDQRRDFEQRFIDLYGYRPPRLATLAYDATALAAVLARSGYERTGKPGFSHEWLTNPNGFAGLDGVFRFRPDGLVERGLAVLAFEDGRIVVRDPAPRTFQRWMGQ